MGLAAGQARLLTLQSRMHDLELQCMRYSNEEIVLSALSNNIAVQYNKMLEEANAIEPEYKTTENVTTGSSNNTYSTLKLKNSSGAYTSFDYNMLKEMGYDIAPKNSLATGTQDANGNTSYTYKSNDVIEEAKKSSDALIEALMSGTISIYKNGSQVSFDSIGIEEVQESSGESTWTETSYIQSVDYSARNAKRQEAENYNTTETNKLSMQEKTLQIKSKQAETEYSAACTEYESVKSMISKNAERGFSLWS